MMSIVPPAWCEVVHPPSHKPLGRAGRATRFARSKTEVSGAAGPAVFRNLAGAPLKGLRRNNSYQFTIFHMAIWSSVAVGSAHPTKTSDSDTDRSFADGKPHLGACGRRPRHRPPLGRPNETNWMRGLTRVGSISSDFGESR